ncbi:hypothetical protein [Paenibacillus sp. IHBB 3054]|uniref:hypothetical protein n=1 Tax=Paenibacillus sp. IHBB 3054 TaxID=3425689 RepID=UPI003F66F223
MFLKIRHKIRPGLAFILAAALAAGPLIATPVHAAAKYTFTDVKTAYNMPLDYNYKFTGDTIASLEKDSKGAYQLYLHNWKKKTTEKVTSTNTFKTNLQLLGDSVYYYESTIEVTKQINIYPKKLVQYNLKTKKTSELPLEVKNPELLGVGDKYYAHSSGSYFYFTNKTTLETQTINDLGFDQVYQFVDDKFIYSKWNTGTLYLYDLPSSKTIEIYKLKENESFNLVASNGKDIVWMIDSKEVDAAGKTKNYFIYMTMDRSKAGAPVKVLLKREWVIGDRNDLLIVGDNYAVFSEMMNNKLVARGVNLRNGELFLLGERNRSADNFVYFNKDTLISRDANDYIVLRTIVRTP